MRFLADESCDFAEVRALRAEGHDVLAVGEFQQRSVDQDVMELAVAEDRILLTEDKDFGRLAFAARADSPGVILIRFPAPARGYDPAVGDGARSEAEKGLRGPATRIDPNPRQAAPEMTSPRN